MAPKKEDSDLTYISLANIRQKGNARDYDRGDEISANEYKLLPKGLKNKFRESKALTAAMLEGDENQLKTTIQQLMMANEALRNEIAVLKGQKVQGKAITTETGGQKGEEKL